MANLSLANVPPRLRDIFGRLEQRSVKFDIYFAAYVDLLERYRGQRNLVLVEIGVLDGGSLLMWREYFGDAVRIIGIDYNDTATRMRDQGFEIFIGDQGSVDFWRQFYAQVGPIDILIDDGGHTNKHQITTVECALEHVRDRGVIVIEDVATSYYARFGNPSRYSFVNYAKTIADRIQTRNPLVQLGAAAERFARAVYSIAFYEGMVCFHIDRARCRPSTTLHVGTDGIDAVDARVSEKSVLRTPANTGLRRALRGSPLEAVARAAHHRVNAWSARAQYFLENRRLRSYFKNR